MRINTVLADGVLVVRVRTHVGEGQFIQIPVAISMAHIVSIEFRYEKLDWRMNDLTYTAQITTSGLTYSDVGSSFSTTYLVIDDEAREVYRLFVGGEPDERGK